MVGREVEPRLCKGLEVAEVAEVAEVDMFQPRREQKELLGTGDGEQRWEWKFVALE